MSEGIYCAVAGFAKMCSIPFGRKKSKKGDLAQDLLGDVFSTYSENGKLDAEGLLKFLQTEQGDSKSSLDDAKHLVELIRNERHKSKFPGFIVSSDLSKGDFNNYVLSPDLNGVLESTVHQDMTQPLSHYFIFTGHNSYLTGNQLSSDSSDVPIAAALQRGVRVVELDLWPDDKGGIKVTHGNTLTSPVAFEKCIKAIKANAFVSSKYPVVITLEDHLSSPLQALAAETLTNILGEDLYYPPSSDGFKELPSPESLKGKILISTKPPKEYLEAAVAQKSALKDEKILNELKKADKLQEQSTAPVKSPVEKKIAVPPSEKTKSISEEKDLSEKVGNLRVDSEGESADPAPASSPDGKKATLTADSESDDDDNKKNPEYARLITIHQSKPSKGTTVEDRLKVEGTVVRISLSETKLEKVTEEFPELVVKFTQRNILRVYPAGNRVNSSNYDPTAAWIHGAQMVAQNMQGYGKELWQAHGKFRGNGGCGYILKPKYLLEDLPNGKPFNPSAPGDTKMILKVKVMTTMGWDKAFPKYHFDLFSPPDFFTRLLVTGVPADVAKWKTSVIDDVWEPHWNEDHEFYLKCPELALLRIEVRDHDEESQDEFEGQACLPMHEIKDGYRCVQMYDKKGSVLKGVKMLFHFQKRSFSPVQ